MFADNGIKFLQVAVVFLFVFFLVFNVFSSANQFSKQTTYQRDLDSESINLSEVLWASSSEKPTVNHSETTTLYTTTQSPDLIDGMDRFDWYLKKVPSDPLKKATNVSLLYAYEFDHEITVTLTNWELVGFRVFCRYLDENGNEIGSPEKSFTYPQFMVNCRKRNGTKRIGLSVEEHGEFEALPLVDRMIKQPKYDLAMCITPLYGTEPKWLMIIEMIEHYKLQGVQHFYMYIHSASNYDLKVINDYVRTGEVEVHYLLETNRADAEWQIVSIADCLMWSRMESKWTIFSDLDERLLMTNYSGRIVDYVREIKDEKIGGIQFRQQWILKTELMPEKYEGEKQIEEWMPTHRWHNSTGIGPEGHTAKCIIDSSKVFIMWVHAVTEFFPGHGYYLKKLDPEEGLVRHYRDQSLGDWGRIWLPGTLKFGPLRLTDYPAKSLGKLTENVKRRASRVYGNQHD